MASSTLPICNKCSELYTDPRILPCLHTFCMKCIEELVDEQQALECLICKERSTVPPGGVSAIPQDVRASNEADVRRIELKMAGGEKCERCTRKDSSEATVFCNTCSVFLCERCAEDHTQVRKTCSHELVGVGKETEGIKDIRLMPNPVPCAQHADETLKFYCVSCEMLVCHDCLVLDHREHEYNRTENVSEREKTDLLSLVDRAGEAKREIGVAMKKREQLVQQVERRKKAVNDRIKEGFGKVYSELRKREETLLTRSGELSLGKTSALEMECRDLKDLRDDISSMCQTITTAVEVYSTSEVLSAKKLMKARLQAYLKKFSETILQPSQTALMPMSLYVSPLLRAIPTVGALTGGSCPSMSTADLYIPRAISNKNNRIKVTARDEHGKRFSQGGENVWVLTGLLGSSEAPKIGTTTDNGDGTYVVSFTPTSEGEHQVKVELNGQAIKCSPFVISVRKEREYTSLTDFTTEFSTDRNPYDVAIHDNGDLYVAAYGAHCVYVLAPNGTHKLSFGTSGRNRGQFRYPSGIALRGNVVYVAEYGNDRIQKLSIEGEHHAFIGEGQLGSPCGVCIDPSGRIFVADYRNNRVQVFSTDGSHAYSITGSSAEGSNLSNPWGVAFDAEGQLHVVNHGSSLVRIFTADGKYVTTYGKDKFNHAPAGIAIDEEGYSFVAEYGSRRACLQIFDPQHQRIHSAPSRNSHLTGVAIDKNGFIWFAECHNNRVTQL